MDKKVTIKISNKELDALEDYCTVDFKGDFEEENRCRKISIKVWRRLVKEWGKK